MSRELNNDEYACLIMRECGRRDVWLGDDHKQCCRFCAGILFSAKELREAGMMLDDDGRPIPRPEPQ